jgi:hypothetical protein
LFWFICLWCFKISKITQDKTRQQCINFALCDHDFMLFAEKKNCLMTHHLTWKYKNMRTLIFFSKFRCSRFSVSIVYICNVLTDTMLILDVHLTFVYDFSFLLIHKAMSASFVESTFWLLLSFWFSSMP